MLLAVLAAAVRTDPVIVAAVVLLVQGQIAVGPHPADARGRTVRAPKVAAVMTASLVATALTLWPRSLIGADGTSAGDIAGVVPGSLVAILPATAAGVAVAHQQPGRAVDPPVLVAERAPDPAVAGSETPVHQATLTRSAAGHA